VGALLAALVLLHAAPRVYGASWLGIASPFAMREREGHTVAWEHVLPAVAVHGMLADDPSPAIREAFNTDHYRALVPIYAAAMLSYWLGSTYWAFAVVDVLAWWLAAWTLYYLARRLGADSVAALLAAALFASSPIAIHQVGAHTAHVASSVSLAPAFLAGLLLVGAERAPLWRRAAGLGAALFAASLCYNYQWIAAPCLLALALRARRPWRWAAAVAAGAGVFLAATALAHLALAGAGLPVRPHLNDPGAVLAARLSAWARAGAFPDPWPLLSQATQLLLIAYHPLVVALAALGLAFARPDLRLLVGVGTVLGLAGAAVYPVPWVAMHGHPFVYASAGLAVAHGPRALLARLAAAPPVARWRPFPPAAPVATALLTLVAVWSTNGDLLGDYGFVARWWGFWYIPR
jgi:hypothetical protein